MPDASASGNANAAVNSELSTWSMGDGSRSKEEQMQLI
jgi:hypothetical protein